MVRDPGRRAGESCLAPATVSLLMDLEWLADVGWHHGQANGSCIDGLGLFTSLSFFTLSLTSKVSSSRLGRPYTVLILENIGGVGETESESHGPLLHANARWAPDHGALAQAAWARSR